MTDVVVFLAALISLWIGSGISVGGVVRLSRSLRISSFLISFIILGTLTSVSELSVAYFSVVNGAPDISLGNLLGASIVLTLLVIPMLAVLNKGVDIDDRHSHINFNVAYLVISLPALLVLDRVVSLFDVILLFCSFVFLALTVSDKGSLLSRIENAVIHSRVQVLTEVSKVIVGVMLIIVGSKYIVDLSIRYSQLFLVSPFLIGAAVLSIGTNLPELSVLFRSTLLKKKNIALGDYVGSAIVNTVIICVLYIFNEGPIVLDNGLKLNLLLLPLGSIAFLIFTRDGRLQRREGLSLLGFYVVFIITELI